LQLMAPQIMAALNGGGGGGGGGAGRIRTIRWLLTR